MEDIFYVENYTDNLCGYNEGEIGDQAYIACNTTMSGQFVQVQNDLIAEIRFHLAEVEIFGFWVVMGFWRKFYQKCGDVIC